MQGYPQQRERDLQDNQRRISYVRREKLDDLLAELRKKYPKSSLVRNGMAIELDA